MRNVLAAALLATACATARPAAPRDLPLSTQVQAPGMLFELTYTPDDAREAERLGRDLLAAGPRILRWGAFRQGVAIRVLPDHEALEAAVDRHGYPWLRAWAFGEEVLLQSPRSWAAPPPESELRELLAHELTHALMYQLIEPPEGGWELEEPPLWFREGMASVTAGQGHRRMSAEDLASWLSWHPSADLLHPSAELYRTEKEAVYGAAHRAFDLLVAQCGDQCVRDVLRGVRDGARFADAFKAGTGRSLAQFEQQAVQSHFASAPMQATGAGGP